MKFLVLSDLHFGDLSVSEDFALPNERPSGVMSGAVSMKKSLVEIAGKEEIDVILVSGDLTSKGSPQEFVGCISTLTEIARGLNVSLSNVIYTYGNHDVDWNITKIPMKSSSDTLKKLYLKVGASVGDVVLSGFGFNDKGPVPGCGIVETDTFRIYVVNSGYYCAHDQSYKHGKLGEEQRIWMENHLRDTLDDNKWHILLMHHHPFNYCYPVEVEDISCLEDGAFVMDLIGKSGLDFVCHGHRHHPILFTEMRTGWISPVTLLCAGSLAVNEQHRCKGEIPNLFHVVSLEKRLQNRAAVGCVKSFEYTSAAGWRSVRYDDRVPLDAEQRFADVYDRSLQKSDIANVIKSVIGDTVVGVCELPEYEDLPLSLQCMSIQKLDEMLRECLSELGQKYMISGKFPDPVMVKIS
ncbi:MAG: metallophosphoesterase family protein [Syntrophales bacterium]